MYRAFRVPSDVCAYFEKKNGKFFALDFALWNPPEHGGVEGEMVFCFFLIKQVHFRLHVVLHK